MRILFMGTPDFAAVILKYIYEAGHEVAGVISQPDKKKGRGQKLALTPVHEYANEKNIGFYSPETLKDNAILPVLNKLDPQMIVVAAYGKILPKYILDYPKYGCINVHASLLPKYRGASPIQQCIKDGCKVTGVTTMYMAQGLDTGDMLLKKQISIGDDETAEQLFDRLAQLGGKAILETIEKAQKNELSPTPQNEEESSYAPLITKESGKIDWSDSAENIKNLVRAMNSWPLAYTVYNGETVKIGSVSIEKCETSEPFGKILFADVKRGIGVAAADGIVTIQTCRFEKKKMMSSRDYLMGHKIDTNVILG